MINSVLFSCKSFRWRTPELIYNQLNLEFNFTLDPCPIDWKPLDQSGLFISWKDQRVFCNPPYSSAGKWVAKGFGAARDENALVVFLLGARTDTSYFHDYCLKGEIRFIRGRLSYGNNSRVRAPFPSMIVIFKPQIPPEGIY